MKTSNTKLTVKKWQLLKWKDQKEEADFTDIPAIAVGKKAFYRNKRLESVIFPKKLAAIKTAAFAECKKLRWVRLPKENSVGLAGEAFRGCERLKTVENGELLTVIGDRSFADCRSLKNLNFARELRRIGVQAFQNCRSLEKLTLPSCVDSIGAEAFRGCWELKELTLEEGLSGLSAGLFRDCISLREIRLPTSIKEISGECFRGCTALETLELGGTVSKIGKKAFFDCHRLQTVTLDLGTVEIAAGAFSKNPNLKEVVCPHTLKKIGFGAFGLGRRKEKICLSVDNEYMKKRIRRLVFFAGSSGCVEVRMQGKTVDERKKERRRSTLEKHAAHIS